MNWNISDFLDRRLDEQAALRKPSCFGVVVRELPVEGIARGSCGEHLIYSSGRREAKANSFSRGSRIIIRAREDVNVILNPGPRSNSIYSLHAYSNKVFCFRLSGKWNEFQIRHFYSRFSSTNTYLRRIIMIGSQLAISHRSHSACTGNCRSSFCFLCISYICS